MTREEIVFRGKRWLNEREFIEYMGMGRNKSRALAMEAGAVHKYGARVIYDRERVDAYMEKTGAVSPETEEKL